MSASKQWACPCADVKIANWLDLTWRWAQLEYTGEPTRSCFTASVQSEARSRETPIVSCKDGDTKPDDETALGCVLGLIEQLKKGVDWIRPARGVRAAKGLKKSKWSEPDWLLLNLSLAVLVACKLILRIVASSSAYISYPPVLWIVAHCYFE